MEISNEELLKKHFLNNTMEAVESLFASQDMRNIAPEILNACYSVDRDESYDTNAKAKILLTCLDLMSNLIQVSESYNDYKKYNSENKNNE